MGSLKFSMLLGLSLTLLGVGLAWTHCPPSTISSLSCHNDYNRRITCVWNSTSVTEHSDNCTLQAHRSNIFNSTEFEGYSTSCKLEPTDVSGLRTCSLDFDQLVIFKSFHVLSLNLMCLRMTEILTMPHRVLCNIKLDAPGKADINGTTLSWIPKNARRMQLEYQLQWRPEERPWTSASVKTLLTSSEECCRVQLPIDSLSLRHRYRARLRVRLQLRHGLSPSEWSNWSPTASWESPVGKTQETPGQDVAGLGTVAAGGAAAFTLILVFICFRKDRICLVYLMKMIQGQPLPNPATSILKMKWQSPPFSNESYLSFFKPVDIIASVELSAADHRPKPEESTCFSSFSNPMYSQLSPAATDLEPCSADSPYGPVGEVEQHTRPELDMLLFLMKATQSEGLPVICDYEKVEAVQVERLRLQSLDSGVCSGEEVSQDSVVLHEDPEIKTTGNVLHSLFGTFTTTVTENLIQVCSEYQQVQDQTLEVCSLDSHQEEPLPLMNI